MNKNIHYVVFIIILGAGVMLYDSNKEEGSNVELTQLSYDENKENHHRLNLETTLFPLEISPYQTIKQQNAPINATRQHREDTFSEKQSFEKKILDEIDNNMASTKLAINESEEKRKIAEAITETYQAAKDGDWDNYIENAENLARLTPEYLNAALLNAVMHNAPLNIIESLINRGAVLSAETVLLLSVRNNITLTKQLVPLGLDLHGKDKSDKNGITYTLMTSPKKEMFDYLIEHNVTVKPNAEGNDPLDLALLLFLKNGSLMIYYVERLINFNAPIGSSHREIVNQIRLENIDGYHQLQTSVPELF